jgi:hypothetical protein
VARSTSPFRLQKFSYRFAEQILNSSLALKQEVEGILLDPSIEIAGLSRPHFNDLLRERFVAKGWDDQPAVFDEPGDPGARMDFMKSRIGIEIEFGHASFLGIDLLKLQTASYSALDRIDVGIYIVTTKSFQRRLQEDFDQNWGGSLTFEKATRYLPHFKSSIQVPVLVIGIDL